MRAVSIVLSLIFAIISLIGCQSQKTATNTESSEMNDTSASYITKFRNKTQENLILSLFAIDSLGIRISADSIKIKGFVIYRPEITTEAKNASFCQESEETEKSSDTTSVSKVSSNNSTYNKTNDIVKKTSSGPTIGDYFQFATVIVVLIIAFVMVRKFLFNRCK